MSDFFLYNKLFYILLLGHLIGDFILQTNNIYYLKNKFFWGQILHAFLVSFVSVIILLFSFHNPLFSIIIFLILFITHFIIDYIKLEIHKTNPLLFLLDQFFHIIVIVFVAMIFFNKMTISSFAENHIYWGFLFSILILITLFMHFFNLSMYSFFKAKIDLPSVYHNLVFVERIVVFIFAYMHGFYFMAIPFIILPRVFYSIKKGNEILLYDILLSMLFSAFCGIIFRKITLNNHFSLLFLLAFSSAVFAISVIVRKTLQVLTRNFIPVKLK